MLQQPPLHQPYVTPSIWPGMPSSVPASLVNPCSNSWLFDNLVKQNYSPAPPVSTTMILVSTHNKFFPYFFFFNE